jgi:hypothetical protein
MPLRGGEGHAVHTGGNEMTIRPQHLNDIVIEIAAADTWVIATVAGERIGTSNDRFDAMRRACAAARATGAGVWVRVDGSSETYHEVICP